MSIKKVKRKMKKIFREDLFYFSNLGFKSAPGSSILYYLLLDQERKFLFTHTLQCKEKFICLWCQTFIGLKVEDSHCFWAIFENVLQLVTWKKVNWMVMYMISLLTMALLMSVMLKIFVNTWWKCLENSFDISLVF